MSLIYSDPPAPAESHGSDDPGLDVAAMAHGLRAVLPIGFDVAIPPDGAWSLSEVALRDALIAEGATYGGDPIPSLPIAVTVTATRWAGLADTLAGLWRETERIVARAWRDPALLARWGLDPAERRLLGDPIERGSLVPLMRVDAVPTADELRVLEINTLFSGLASSEVLARNVARLTAIHPASTRPQPSAAAMLARYLANGRRAVLAGRPGIDPIAEEYRCTVRELVRQGLAEVELASIEDLAAAGDGRLTASGHPVDALYLRGSYADWLAQPDVAAAVDAAWRAGTLRMAGPFAGLLADSKAALAVLDRSDARIDAVLPETRLFGGSGDAVLRAGLLAGQTEWVLKPSDGFGGAGVTIGRDTDAAAWRLAVERADARWVAQRHEPQPSFVVEGRRWWFNLNLIQVEGALAGGFARLSRDPVANIARGGMMLAVCVVDDADAVEGGR